MDNDCNEGCGDGEEVGDDNDEGDDDENCDNVQHYHHHTLHGVNWQTFHEIKIDICNNVFVLLHVCLWEYIVCWNEDMHHIYMC